jgi:Rps23 Pro-64 3,4-dihydroxylase Tpa1-like proline 4-hydroxylase
MTYKLELLQEPFPHAIIRDFYTEDELSLIWRELEFLNSPNKLVSSEFLGTAKDPISQMFKSTSYGLGLDEAYPNRNISDILTINRKVFNKELTEKFASLHPLMGHIKQINLDFTKIRYYEDGQYYNPHHDIARFTASSYFFKEPRSFTGGDLHFPEFNYTITIENNMLVFFVGSILHTSTPLKMKNPILPFLKKNGYGKYVMTQFLDIEEKK